MGYCRCSGSLVPFTVRNRCSTDTPLSRNRAQIRPNNMNISSQLATALRGRVITPGSSEYEVARKVYNGMIDRHPDVVVRCANVADVRTAVNFARQEGLTVAIRGGGHNGAGLGVCDHGMVIDLSP